VRPGRKIGNSKKSVPLLFWEFIFFPKDWLIRTSLNKKFVEPVRPGRKIGNSKKSVPLLFWEFIFFPKDWLIRTSLNKKFVEPLNSGKKIGKFDVTFFVTSKFHLSSERLTHKN
ncbi:hypothetical protein, partial [Carnobacterium maltaromaticum]|uniref:hypothetical protein n=1 Tax=Carnobacterium maltaromaticum TaxID=2751 RepID=UPI001F1E20A1